MSSSATLILIIVLLAMLSSMWAAPAKPAEKVKLPIYNLTLPDGKGLPPCLIICPGRGYHKELPLIKGLAKQADLDGFATVRFDWTFFTEQTKPSEDGSAEMEDLTAIIEMVRANPKLDSTRIYISGKSLGSLLAYAAFRENTWLKGCILLTPVLPSAEAGEDYYPNLTFETRPLAFILGDKDIDNCPLTELYKLISTCATAFPVVALAGGHGFELGYDDKDAALKQINAVSIKAAIDSAVYWLKVFEYPAVSK